MDAVDADDHTQGTSPGSLSLGAEPDGQGQAGAGENTGGKQAEVRDERPGGQKRSAPAKKARNAVVKPFDTVTHQLVESLVVVAPNGKPGERLCQNGLIEILARILKTPPNMTFIGKLTKTILEGQRNSFTPTGKSNPTQVLDGVILADLDKQDVFDPLLKLLTDIGKMGGLSPDMLKRVALIAGTRDDSHGGDDAWDAALATSKTAVADIKESIRSLFKEHLSEIPVGADKKKRSQPKKPAKPRTLNAVEKAAEQNRANAAALETVTGEAWQEYTDGNDKQRDRFTREELIHMRVMLDPRSRAAYESMVREWVAEWDNCKAPGAVAETPPGNAPGEQGQEGRGRSAERATLVNSPTHTTSQQDPDRGRTPSPDIIAAVNNMYPTPPAIGTPNTSVTPGSGGSSGGGRRRQRSHRKKLPSPRRLDIEAT